MELELDTDRDQVLRCRTCGAGYILTPKERQWWFDRGLNLPKHCPACRRQRREAPRG